MKPSAKSTPNSAGEWTDTENRIILIWMESGMTRDAAEAALRNDLKDAAEEDGYDGP